MVQDSRVKGRWSRVLVLGVRCWCGGFRVQGLGSVSEVSGVWIESSGSSIKISALGFHGLDFEV